MAMACALNEINRMEEGKRHADSSLASPCHPVKHSHRLHSEGLILRDRTQLEGSLFISFLFIVGRPQFQIPQVHGQESREPNRLFSSGGRDGVFSVLCQSQRN